jgi:hypothetical protein
MGVLWPAIKTALRGVVNRQSLKQVYPEVLRIIEPYLIEKYSPIVQEYNSSICLNLEHKRSKVVWFCWLQGLDQAPPIVKACYASLERWLVHGFTSSRFQVKQGYEIIVIDNENWRKYVELPEYIVKKWEKGRIPAALFSDLLRLELLIHFGGTWIDSTVLCTGINNIQNENYLDADLFFFQYTKQGSIPVRISNWFITACTNNEVLVVLRDMLFAYWKDYDCVLDYYIFHLFFAIISKGYPEQIAAMPYGQSQNSLVLLHHWGEKFEQKKWDKLTSQVCFHKLAFRVGENVTKDKENYYNYILTEYGRI